MCDQLIGCIFLARLWLLIISDSLFRLPLRRCGIHSDHEILTRLITGCTDCLENLLDCFLIRRKLIRCESTLITNGCYIAHIFDKTSQCMEHLCTPAKRFLEGRCPNRHDHEFLCVNSGIRMCTTVQDIHHRNRKCCALNTAKELIKWNVKCDRCGSCCCNRYGKNCVCTKIRLIFCAIKRKHCCINCVDIRSIHAYKHFCDLCIDVIHCLGGSLAKIS